MRRPGLPALMCSLIATWAATAPLGAQGAEPEGPPAPALTAETPLDEITFKRWVDHLQPSADEVRWREIPWRESFWQGIRDAHVLRKPVLLWTMNGHPMGCT